MQTAARAAWLGLEGSLGAGRRANWCRGAAVAGRRFLINHSGRCPVYARAGWLYRRLSYMSEGQLGCDWAVPLPGRAALGLDRRQVSGATAGSFAGRGPRLVAQLQHCSCAD
jgi:hypothetical protein